MNVKVMRTNIGEEVIFTLINEEQSTIEIENPLVAMPNAQGQVGFGPWSFLQKKDTTLTVDRSFIVSIYEAEEEIVANYEKIFNPDKIQTPSKKLIL
tara:strand:- start:350 stop:640 length:291 start_codon:yes stop_codon:yes gene_type:complete